jgi:hypothetical protein
VFGGHTEQVVDPAAAAPWPAGQAQKSAEGEPGGLSCPGPHASQACRVPPVLYVPATHRLQFVPPKPAAPQNKGV